MHYKRIKCSRENQYLCRPNFTLQYTPKLAAVSFKGCLSLPNQLRMRDHTLLITIVYECHSKQIINVTPFPNKPIIYMYVFVTCRDVSIPSWYNVIYAQIGFTNLVLMHLWIFRQQMRTLIVTFVNYLAIIMIRYVIKLATFKFFTYNSLQIQIWFIRR